MIFVHEVGWTMEGAGHETIAGRIHRDAEGIVVARAANLERPNESAERVVFREKSILASSAGERGKDARG
ncbi:MAG: hypothetical protein NTW03_14440, partial [Verrucomicrobia bacterium]|nr:hypothetical protein [Verrucomicrobiota bacterium]